MVDHETHWSPTGKNATQGDEYESLRQAYDDRVKSLAKRLKGTCQTLQASPGRATYGLQESGISSSPREMPAQPTPSAPSAKLLQLRMKDIVEGELSQERENQINVLAQKVGHLHREKLNLHKEFEDMEERFKDILADLKQQMTVATQRYNDKKMDWTQLSQQVQDEEQHHQTERQFIHRSGEDAIASLGTEIKDAQSMMFELDDELAAAQNELREYHQRIEVLYQERAKAQEEEVAITVEASAIKEELQTVQHSLAQSQAERNELVDRYQSVGQKFEYAMDMSEKENKQVVMHLQQKIEKGKHKVDKYHGKLEKSQSALAAAQAALKIQFSNMHDKETEIKRLQGLCEDERKQAAKKEAQFYETQRQALQEQGQELQRYGEMMPVAAHQQILYDQGNYYRGVMKELEDSLKQQIKEAERDAKERENRAIKEYEDKVAQCKNGAKELDVVNDEALIRCQRLEEELKDVRSTLTQSEINIAEVEEQRRTFMNSLEVATVRLGNLRGVLEEERKHKEVAVQESKELGKQTAELINQIAAREAKLHSQLCGQGQIDCTELQKQIEDCLTKITDIESAWEEFKDKSRKCHEELLALGAAKKNYEQRLKDADLRVSQSEKICAREQVASRKRQEAMFRIRCSLEGHVDFSRQELGQLKDRFSSEQKAVLNSLGIHLMNAETQAHRQALQKVDAGSKNADEELRTKRAEIEEHKVRSEELETQLLELKQKKAFETEKLKLVRQECEDRRSRLHQQKEAVANLSLNMERLILCIGAAVPDSLSEEVKEKLRGDAKQFGEGLKGLRLDLSGGIGRLCQTCVDAERVVADARLRKAKQDAETEIHTLSRALVKHQSAADVKTKDLSQRLETLQQLERAAVQSHTEKLRKSQDNKRSLEMKLQETEEQVQEKEDEVERQKKELQQFEVEVSMDLEDQLLKQERPLKNAIDDLEPEVRMLRKRMRHELAQRDRFWEAQLKKVEKDWSASWKAKERQLVGTIDQLQKKLKDVRDAESKASQQRERTISDLSATISRSINDIEENSNRKQKLENEHEIILRNTQRRKEAVKRLEQRISDLAEVRRRDYQELENTRQQSSHLFEEEAKKLRVLKEKESQKARRRTTVVSLGDHSRSLQQSSQLEKISESLAQRAMVQLDDRSSSSATS